MIRLNATSPINAVHSHRKDLKRPHNRALRARCYSAKLDRGRQEVVSSLKFCSRHPAIPSSAGVWCRTAPSFLTKDSGFTPDSRSSSVPHFHLSDSVVCRFPQTHIVGEREKNPNTRAEGDVWEN